MAAVTLSPPAIAQTDRLYRIDLDTYHRIAELGVLGKHDRVVLLDGLLVTKMTRHAPHVTITLRTRDILGRIVPAGWHARQESPISLRGGPTGHDSEPEPDVAVVRGTIDDYASRHPEASEVALVVDVADSSLAEDRAGLVCYAWAGIPVAWVVNLPERQVEVCSEPTGPEVQPRYRKLDTYRIGETLPVVLAGLELGRIAVKDLLS